MKVFCIGLSKTGTRSLHDALRILGLRSVHWGGPDLQTAVQRGPEIKAAVERALAEGRPLLDDVEEADAYSDILALTENFDVLDRQYPGSRFVLTLRDMDEWLASRQRHVEANVAMRARGEYHGTFLEVDLEGWRAEAEEHERRVRAHFADRPQDLLVMDIAAGDGWEVLCPFLGFDVPEQEFPAVADRPGAGPARRTVLHVGMHKTGSTSIQQFLLEEGALLASVGACCPPGFLIPSLHADLPLLVLRPGLAWPARLRFPETEDPGWQRAAADHIRSSVAAAPQPVVVWSHEDLSYVRHDDELARLHDLLGEAPVQVVVYHRRRADFLRSYREQLQATGFELSEDRASFAYVQPDSWVADHHAVIAAYRRRFGHEQVAVIDYDEVVHRDGSVIPAFAALLGLAPDDLPSLDRYFFNRPGGQVRLGDEHIEAIRRRAIEQSGG